MTETFNYQTHFCCSAQKQMVKFILSNSVNVKQEVLFLILKQTKIVKQRQ